MIDADRCMVWTGVQRVDAGCAMKGRVGIFNQKTSRRLPAGRQSDGRLGVTLPTTVMPTGIAIAMVRAVIAWRRNVSEIETSHQSISSNGCRVRRGFAINATSFDSKAK